MFSISCVYDMIKSKCKKISALTLAEHWLALYKNLKKIIWYLFFWYKAESVLEDCAAYCICYAALFCQMAKQ